MLIMKHTDPVSFNPMNSHWFRQLVQSWRGRVGGREWRRAAGRFLISDTTWIDPKGGCNSTMRHWQCEVLKVMNIRLTNYYLDCISIPKFYFITAHSGCKNHCWNAQTSAFLLAVRSVAHRNDDFAAITSWCWGYEHGASEELLTVHG